MKKLILVLCVIFAMSCVAALAENATTIPLWEHTFIEENEAGEAVSQTVFVSLTVNEPVEMNVIQNEVNDGYIAIISRKGVAPVSVDIYPADVALHANLKDATEDEQQILIDYMSEQYEEGEYTVEKNEENGNVYIAVGVSNIRSVMTVIENVEMELIQAHFEEHFEDLTTEDQEFAAEILRGITIQ